MHAYKIIKWCPTQCTAVLQTAFFDRGKFEAVKMLSGGRAPHCSKH